jgi:crossover junction endodeoxyribonuclease RusA
MEQGADAPASEGVLTLTLPLPPSINHQYATVNGRRILSRAGREFKALVTTEVEHWRDQHPEIDVTLFQRHYLGLTITFYFLSALRRDLDGGLKIAQDALCEALGVNDNLVVEIHLTKRVDRQVPRIEVQLSTLRAASLSLEAEGTSPCLTPLPTRPRRRPKRRRQHAGSSLEALAVRHKWE